MKIFHQEGDNLIIETKEAFIAYNLQKQQNTN